MVHGRVGDKFPSHEYGKKWEPTQGPSICQTSQQSDKNTFARMFNPQLTRTCELQKLATPHIMVKHHINVCSVKHLKSRQRSTTTQPNQTIGSGPCPFFKQGPGKIKQLDAAQVQQCAEEGESRNAREATICDGQHVQNRIVLGPAHVSHQRVLPHSESSWRQEQQSLGQNHAGYFQPCNDPGVSLRPDSTARRQIHRKLCYSFDF